MNMQNMTLEGRRLSQAGDPQKTWLFQMLIPNIKRICPTLEADDIAIRLRSLSIMGRGHDVMESHFLGRKQIFPGKVILPTSMEVQLEEFEDQKVVIDMLYQWNQAITSIEPDGKSIVKVSKIPGASLYSQKRAGYATNVYIQMAKYDGTILENQLVLQNCWPSNVADVSMSMDASDSVKYSVTLSFDYPYWAKV